MIKIFVCILIIIGTFAMMDLIEDRMFRRPAERWRRRRRERDWIARDLERRVTRW